MQTIRGLEDRAAQQMGLAAVFAQVKLSYEDASRLSALVNCAYIEHQTVVGCCRLSVFAQVEMSYEDGSRVSAVEM